MTKKSHIKTNIDNIEKIVISLYVIFYYNGKTIYYNGKDDKQFLKFIDESSLPIVKK